MPFRPQAEGYHLRGFFMPKRFTDSGKFRNPWYRSMSPKIKCLWEYMLSECDIAGIIEIDLPSMSFHIGEEIHMNDLSVFDEKIYFIDEKKVFIPSFIEFQQKELNENNKAHKNIIKTLEKYNIPVSLDMKDFQRGFKGASKGLQSPTGNSKGKGKGNSKGISKSVCAKKNEDVFIPNWIDPNVWDRWVKARAEIKKPLTPLQAQAQIKKLERWMHSGHDVNEILESSIAGGYQGLFEPKTKPNRKANENEYTVEDAKREALEELGYSYTGS